MHLDSLKIFRARPPALGEAFKGLTAATTALYSFTAVFVVATLILTTGRKTVAAVDAERCLH